MEAKKANGQQHEPSLGNETLRRVDGDQPRKIYATFLYVPALAAGNSLNRHFLDRLHRFMRGFSQNPFQFRVWMEVFWKRTRSYTVWRMCL